MNNIAYLDCFSGVSGDMLLGALLDLGLPLKELRDIVDSLGLHGVDIVAKKESRHNISGTRFHVNINKKGQPPRDLDAIRALIRKGKISDSVKQKSMAAFDLMAEAEAAIHGCTRESVHFHEVGAADSIIDVVGTIYGFERLKLSPVFSSPLPLGTGFVDTMHGTIPVPSPATIAILKDIPVTGSGLHAEMVTPTGALLLKILCNGFGRIPPMVIKKTGYGVGKRDLKDRPNLLRIIIGKDATGQKTETVALVETNIDDCSPEVLGFLMERLFDAGALDVSFCHIGMKKNRPGILLQVIANPHDKDMLMDIIFRETGTLGIRFSYKFRKVIKRKSKIIASPWGSLAVKETINDNGSTSIFPEYEACRTIAITEDVPLMEIYTWVQSQNRCLQQSPCTDRHSDGQK